MLQKLSARDVFNAKWVLYKIWGIGFSVLVCLVVGVCLFTAQSLCYYYLFIFQKCGFKILSNGQKLLIHMT